MRSDW